MRFRTLWRWLLPLVPLGILSAAWYVFFSSHGGTQVITNLTLREAGLKVFPVFGLTAFVLVWTQLMLGSLMPWFRGIYLGAEKFHRRQGPFVLLFSLLHPLWLLTGLGWTEYWSRAYVAESQRIFILFGYAGALLMCVTVMTALLRTWRPLERWWRRIHYANYLIFFSVWIHSWNLGSDVQSTGLRVVWEFMLAAAVVAVVYRFWPRRQPAEAIPAEQYVKVATLDDVRPGHSFCSQVGGRAVALFNLDGQVYALDNTCSHADGPLCEGFVDGTTVECPLHSSQFDIRTGAVITGPATAPQPTYPVRVQGRDIEIRV